MTSPSINPVIPGFAPDPSVTLIGNTFFLVNSTFHIYPGLPIYASKDLISWKQIGNAINRQSQLSLAATKTALVPLEDKGEVMLATGGLYAPTIRHHNGTVYIVCTNIVDGPAPSENATQNFIISTRDIWSNQWSDPTYFDFNGYDPSLFFDDDGRSYIQGAANPGPTTKIKQFQIDLETGKGLSEQKEIWNGTVQFYPEGPHLYKKDGWYYLMIAEGGTHDGHMINIARATDIWGPYDPYESNPILTARGTNEYIQYVGHGDLFQDVQGQWWCVCLGVRKDEEGRFVLGRETFLTTVEWPKGGWPLLRPVKLSPLLHSGKEIRRKDAHVALTAAPTFDLVYIRDPDLGSYQFSNDDSTVCLTAGSADLSDPSHPVAFIGKRQRKLEGTTSVLMRLPDDAKDANIRSGLAYYKDEHRYARIFYDSSASNMVFEVINNAKSISRRVEHQFAIPSQGGIHLRLTYDERSCSFAYRNSQQLSEWKAAGTLDTLDLTDPDFVGPLVGVFAVTDAKKVQVKFDGLEVD